MTTTIQSNGSKWAGELPDSIDTLLDVLGKYPLDRTFEAFGDFVIPDPVNMRGDRLLPDGGVHFFGNFFNLSHVFSIDTDEPELIERLTAAIRLNQQRPDYLAQHDYATVQAEAAARQAERDAKRQAEREQQARAILGLGDAP